MANAHPRSFENHRQIVPMYLAALGILFLNILRSIYRLVRIPGVESRA